MFLELAFRWLLPQKTQLRKMRYKIKRVQKKVVYLVLQQPIFTGVYTVHVASFMSSCDVRSSHTYTHCLTGPGTAWPNRDSALKTPDSALRNRGVKTKAIEQWEQTQPQETQRNMFYKDLNVHAHSLNWAACANVHFTTDNGSELSERLTPKESPSSLSLRAFNGDVIKQ